MIRILSCLAVAGITTAMSLAQTYWVHSATVTHAGGWPTDYVNTTTGNPPVDGYIWQAIGTGGQSNPGGNQTNDPTKGIVDGVYSLTGDFSVVGAASGSEDFVMEREDITITFKIRCSNVGSPPSPGTAVFDLKGWVYADVNVIWSPRYNHGYAKTWYIAPNSESVVNILADAELPGGAEADGVYYTNHRQESDASPSAWSSVGTNLWECTVVMPIPDAEDDPDQDVKVFGEGYNSIGSGGGVSAWSHAATGWRFRCRSLGNVALQPAL